MDVCRSTCTRVFAKKTDVCGITCTNVSTISTVVFGIMCIYDNYEMHGPKQVRIDQDREHEETYGLSKVREGVSYADMFHSMRSL